MAAASRPEAVFCCANAQGGQGGAIRANRDRNFIFVPEVPILARRGDDSLTNIPSKLPPEERMEALRALEKRWQPAAGWQARDLAPAPSPPPPDQTPLR